MGQVRLGVLEERRAAVRAAEVIRDAVDLRRVAGRGQRSRSCRTPDRRRVAGAGRRDVRAWPPPTPSACACRSDAPGRFRRGSTARPPAASARRGRGPPDSASLATPGTPRSSSSARTAAPRVRDATRPTYGTPHFRIDFERLLVVVPLRRDDGRTVAPPGRSPQDRLERVERRRPSRRAPPPPARCRAARAPSTTRTTS